MKGEEGFAHERGSLQIGKEMFQEMGGICVSSVVMMVNICRALGRRAVVKDDDLIDGEDCQGSCNTAGICCPLLTSYATEADVNILVAPLT